MLGERCQKCSFGCWGPSIHCTFPFLPLLFSRGSRYVLGSPKLPISDQGSIPCLRNPWYSCNLKRKFWCFWNFSQISPLIRRYFALASLPGPFRWYSMKLFAMSKLDGLEEKLGNILHLSLIARCSFGSSKERFRLAGIGWIRWGEWGNLGGLQWGGWRWGRFWGGGRMGWEHSFLRNNCYILCSASSSLSIWLNTYKPKMKYKESFSYLWSFFLFSLPPFSNNHWCSWESHSGFHPYSAN